MHRAGLLVLVVAGAALAGCAGGRSAAPSPERTGERTPARTVGPEAAPNAESTAESTARPPLATPPASITPAQALETFDAAWRIVHRTHYDTTFGGVDWPAVRDRYRPRAEAAASTVELRRTLEAMLGELGESHFALLPRELVDGSGIHPEGLEVKNTSGQPGFEVQRVEDRFVITEVDSTGPAAREVRSGWEVLEVDGVDLETGFAPLGSAPSALGPDLRAWMFAREALGGSIGSIALLVLRDGEGHRLERRIPRVGREGEIRQLGNLPPILTRFESFERTTPGGAQVAVLRFNNWMIPVAAAFDQAVDDHRQADGFVIDLRGNLGGLANLIMGVSGHFLDQRTVLGTIRTRDHDLQLKANPRRVTRDGKRVNPHAGPLAILIDGRSYSASEFFAGGMQAIGRARVFGRASPGGALGAAMDRLPNGDVLEHAISDFETATGTRLEGRGVVPDVPVPLTQRDLLEGRDRDLEAALEWIDSEIAAKQ